MTGENATTWSTGDAEKLYGVRRWGQGYFRVNEAGHLAVHPRQDEVGVDLKALVDELRQRDVSTPMLLRFTDVLDHRVTQLAEAFNGALAEYDYGGEYRCVYPIKVNQSRHVVEEIYHFGRQHGFGLEAGSKPELLAVMAIVDSDDTPIICNGFKDAEFIEAVVLAKKIGRRVIPVIEKMSEVEELVRSCKQHGAVPEIGVRVKLTSKGAGRWEQSGGVRSKFGLFVSEILEVLDYLKQHDMADALAMLHFHLGSQIYAINNVRDAISELARVYVELRALGASGLNIVDVGGGLGVDYDGSASANIGSINYGLREYANDVVWHVKDICDKANEPHPTIVSESGRAMVAYHAVMVFDVIGWSGFQRFSLPTLSDEEREALPTPVKMLAVAHDTINEKNVGELFHDIEADRRQMEDLFRLGYCSLKDRALGEKFYFATASKILRIAKQMEDFPTEFDHLESMLSDTYFCNMSIFQSMPDSWAIDQLFPIMPIHRLGEQPTCRGILADVTCDSDGKIDRFVGGHRARGNTVRETLPMHPYTGESYLIGAFLVGAYQEILGDLHNLFGDTHAVHVRIDAKGRYQIDEVIEGDDCETVLKYVHYDPKQLVRLMRRHVETALRGNRISVAESRQLLKFYEDGLEGYTYLE
jgi:arginine decarboxylase